MILNYELPDDPENYIHRIGRTGRAGDRGKAYSFVSDRDVDALMRIEDYVKHKLSVEWLDEQEIVKEFTKMLDVDRSSVPRGPRQDRPRSDGPRGRRFDGPREPRREQGREQGRDGTRNESRNESRDGNRDRGRPPRGPGGPDRQARSDRPYRGDRPSRDERQRDPNSRDDGTRDERQPHPRGRPAPGTGEGTIGPNGERVHRDRLSGRHGPKPSGDRSARDKS